MHDFVATKTLRVLGRRLAMQLLIPVLESIR